MSTQHTKEPWKVINSDTNHGAYIEDDSGTTVCDLYFLQDVSEKVFHHDNAGANARRIVACVNACAGIETKTLESFKEHSFTKALNDVTEQRDNLLFWKETVINSSPLLERCLSAEQLCAELLTALKLAMPALEYARKQFPRSKHDDSMDVMEIVRNVIAKAEAS